MILSAQTQKEITPEANSLVFITPNKSKPLASSSKAAAVRKVFGRILLSRVARFSACDLKNRSEPNLLSMRVSPARVHALHASNPAQSLILNGHVAPVTLLYESGGH